MKLKDLGSKESFNKNQKVMWVLELTLILALRGTQITSPQTLLETEGQNNVYPAGHSQTVTDD